MIVDTDHNNNHSINMVRHPCRDRAQAQEHRLGLQSWLDSEEWGDWDRLYCCELARVFWLFHWLQGWLIDSYEWMNEWMNALMRRYYICNLIFFVFCKRNFQGPQTLHTCIYTWYYYYFISQYNYKRAQQSTSIYVCILCGWYSFWHISMHMTPWLSAVLCCDALGFSSMLFC